MVTAPPGSPCSPVISARLARWSVTSGYVVGNVNQSMPGTGTFAEYHAIANPSQTVTVPFWHNGQDEWTSGVAIQNVNDRYVSGFVDYYWSTQGLFTYESFTLAPHETRLYVNTPTGLGWTGTVRIWADAPVAVVSNFTRNAADGLMSEAGVHK